MTLRHPRRSSEAELDAFETVCERLSGFGDVVDPEWADGFLTALVTGPVRPPPERWLPVLAGDAFERAYADPPDRAQALRALDARLAAIADALDPDALLQWPDELRLDPLMAEIDDAERARLVDDGLAPEQAAQMRTGSLWAEGFLAADEAFALDWGTAQVTGDARDAYLELVAEVEVLRVPPGSEDEPTLAESRQPDGPPPHDPVLTEALFAVQDLRLWWLDHAPRPETRRVAPLPGRNDPCPCGSGRKFKKCHGASS
jgi:uncharacterized protein